MGLYVQTGAVGVFFTAELFQRFLVFGAHQANTVHSSMNVEYVISSGVLQ